MEGTIVLYKPTNSLSIMGTISTQRYVTLRVSCILKYKLKVGDRVMYDGGSDSVVYITAKYLEAEQRWESDSTKILEDMDKVNYTIEQGLKVQKEELKTWKKVLKDEVYNDLEYWITSKNHLAEDGHDIKKGSFMTTFITHYDPYYKNEVVDMKKRKENSK